MQAWLETVSKLNLQETLLPLILYMITHFNINMDNHSRATVISVCNLNSQH